MGGPMPNPTRKASIRRRALLTVAALPAVAAACGGCPDSRCSVQNCQAMIDSCHVVNTPENPICIAAFQSGLYGDGGVDLYADCVRVCQQENQGASLQCIADHAAACITAQADGGHAQTALTACTDLDAGTTDPTCAENCFNTQTSCAKGCLTTTPAACDDCSLQCQFTYDQCYRNCPET
jgi:hypothetical protein